MRENTVEKTPVFTVVLCSAHCNHLNSRHGVCFEHGVLEIQATKQRGFSLKRVHWKIRMYSLHIHVCNNSKHKQGQT